MRKIGGCVLYMWCFKSYLTLYLFAWPSTEGIMSYFSRVACYKSVYVCLSAVITSLLYVYCFNAFCVGDLWCLKLWNAECTTNSADSEAYQTLIISSGWLQTFMYFLFLEIFFFLFHTYLKFCGDTCFLRQTGNATEKQLSAVSVYHVTLTLQLNKAPGRYKLALNLFWY